MFNTIAQLRFERLGNQQGLSQSTVLKIFQDKKGFIWFATRDGLNKYDGYNFTVYRHILNNPKSISSSNITCITEDKNENLWIGTADGGINKMDKETGEFVHFKQTDSKNDIAKLNIASIIVTNENQILAASHRPELLKIDGNTNTISWKIFEKQPLARNDVSQIYQDRKGNLFLGCPYGVFTQIAKDGKANKFRIVVSLYIIRILEKELIARY